jgi:hypothetical protein
MLIIFYAVNARRCREVAALAPIADARYRNTLAGLNYSAWPNSVVNAATCHSAMPKSEATTPRNRRSALTALAHRANGRPSSARCSSHQPSRPDDAEHSRATTKSARPTVRQPAITHNDGQARPQPSRTLLRPDPVIIGTPSPAPLQAPVSHWFGEFFGPGQSHPRPRL